MSQSRSAHAAQPEAVRARRRAGSSLAMRNWRMASRLIVLVAIPTVLALGLAGSRVADAARSGQAYGRLGQLAGLGQQVIGLAQAMEDERDDAGVFIAGGRQALGRAALNRQYVTTDRRSITVRRLALGLGTGFPARTRSSTATILADIAELPGLRTQAVQSQASALTVINGYSHVIDGLLQANKGIAYLSGNSSLVTGARALGSLSGMEDQASLQEALLAAALTEGRFGPGVLTALTTADARRARDYASFRGSATPEQTWALTTTLGEPLVGQAQEVERRATAVGNGGALALGADASQRWSAGMSYTAGWMRHAEQQLAGWITGYAQDLQRSAMRSAMTIGGLALAVLLLVVAATLIISRSMVRRLRRLEAAALDIAETHLPAAVSALGVAGNSGRPLPVPAIDVQSVDEIGQVARAVDRVHREAVRLAGEQARMRGSLHAIFISFLRRSSSLLDPMLRLIDDLELSEEDPERLAALFQIDHLATRMRRNSDSALVLAGDQTRWTEPVTLIDLLRAALSEIEQYGRVLLDVEPAVSITASATVTASAAVDIVHMLAELLENAATFSPATAQVSLSGRTSRDGGWLVTITDRGVGIPEEQVERLNELLAEPTLAEAAARHIGLFAVAHLAARHGIHVEILQPPGGGTTAEVRIPAALISRNGGTAEAAEAPWALLGGGADAADPVFWARSFAADPQHAMEPEPAAGMQMLDPIPLVGAPLSPLAGSSTFAATAAEPTGADSAQIARSRLASFQKGSLRGRAAARLQRAAEPKPDN